VQLDKDNTKMAGNVGTPAIAYNFLGTKKHSLQKNRIQKSEEN
jgi:hypothetical protein